MPCIFFLNAGIRSQDLCPPNGISVTGGDEENIIYWGDWQDFTETFDTELSDDWTVINSGTAPDYSWNWTQPTGTQSIDGTPYMRVDSDAAGLSNDFLDEELITPVINSDGMGGLYLVFDHYYKHLGNSQADVDVWDGDDWVTVASFTTSSGIWSAPVQEVLDLSDYANPELQVRFHYIDGGSWAWYWALDNVVISATAPGERSVYTYTLTEFGWDMNTLSKEELIEKYPVSGGPYSIVDESSIEEHIVNTRDIPEECGTFSIYRVYDAADNSIIGETTELSYTHASLTNGQEYCYYVTVVYDEGESEGTDTECGTPASPVPEATISLDNVFGLPGDTVVVGVDIEMENDYSINSYEMTFVGFGNFAVELLGVETSGTLTEQFDWMISINDLDSSVTVAAAGDAEMTYGGTLLQLRFAIDSDAQGAEIPIIAYDILLNEDYASADTNSGSIVIPEGCTDNYVAIFCDSGSWQGEVSWVLFNSDGDSVAAGGAPYESDFCLPSDAYTLLMYDSYGDGWNGNMWGIYDYIADSIVVSLTLESGTEGSEILLLGDAEHVLGCVDPYAINYNEDATQDDGSCLYNGDLCSAAVEAAEGDVGNQADGNDEWFYFTATMDGYITVTTCYDNQPEDTDVYIYSGCPADGGFIIDGADDSYCGDITGGNDFASEVTIAAVSGETLFIFWDDTWNPGPFTWYLYESPPQNGPEDLTATAGSGQVFLEWDPSSPAVNSRENPGASISGNIGLVQDDAYEQWYATKKESFNQTAGYRGITRTMLYERLENDGSQTRDTGVFITFYDSWGDGHYGGDCNGCAYLVTEEGDTLNTLAGGWSGLSNTYGPFTLADGLYSIEWDQSASWLNEQSMEVTDANDTTIVYGEGPAPSACFAIGADYECPEPDLSASNLVYDNANDALNVDITNNGGVISGQFFVTYYITTETIGECNDTTYWSYASVSNLDTSATVTVGSGSGLLENLEEIGSWVGYGSYTFGVMVDQECTVDESDETNNTFTGSVMIQDPLEGVQWNIYRQESGGEFGFTALIESAPEYADIQVTGGTEYCYYVTQLDGNIESDSSNIACATPAGGTIVVDPYPVEFDDTQATMVSQDIVTTISNGTPEVGLIIQTVSITGDDAEHFQLDDGNTYPVTITDGNIAVNVSFYPQTTGEKSALLYITSATEAFSVPLSGRGYMPPPTNLTTISWGDYVVLDWTLPDQNIGCGDFVIDELPFTHQYNNTGMGDDWLVSGSQGEDVAYTLNVSETATYAFNLCSEFTDYDTKIEIFTNDPDCATPVSTGNYNDDGPFGTCTESPAPYTPSNLENISLTPGQYYVVIDGFGGATGNYEITISLSGGRNSIGYVNNSIITVWPAEEIKMAELGYSQEKIDAYTEIVYNSVSANQEHGTAFIPYTATRIQEDDENHLSSRDRQITDFIIYRTRNADLAAEDFNLLSIVSSEYSPPYNDYQVDVGAKYYYSVSALDDTLGESDRSAIVSALPLAAMALPFETNLENDDGGFIADDITQWEWGVPNYGPDNAFSGVKVWGTNLSGNYQHNSEDLLYSVFNIPESGLPVILQFMAWYNLESDHDYLNVVVDHDNDGQWNVIESFTGASAGWQNNIIILPDEYRTAYTKIGFRLDTDISTNAPGFYVDDIFVLNASMPAITTTQDALPQAVEDMLYTLNIDFTDLDGVSSDEYQVELAGTSTEWLSVNSIDGQDGSYTIELTGTPDDDNLYQNQLTITVTDAMSIESQPAGFTLDIVAVNDPPMIIGYDGETVFDEDTELTLILYFLAVVDPDNTFPGDFVVQGVTIQEGENYTSSGQTIIPNTDYFGALTVPITINDGTDDSVPFDLSLTVSSVNDAPVITTAVADTAAEGTSYSLPIEFTDVEGSIYGLEFSAEISGSAAEWLSVGDIIVHSEGEYTLPINGTPDDQNLNENSLIVAISDGDDISMATYSISIVEVNDVPLIVDYVGNVEIDEDTEFTPSLYFLTVVDPDNIFPGDFVAQGLTVHEGEHYTINGQTIIPNTNYFGALPVPITVNDGSAESAPFDIEVEVLPINDAPVITAQIAINTNEDDSVLVTTDMLVIEDVDGESLFTVLLYDGDNYSVSDNDIIIPDQDYNGIISIATQVEDSSGALSNIYSLLITVQPVNDPPVATDVQLSPSIPLLSEDIILSYTFNDVDDDSESGTEIIWYRNGLAETSYANMTSLPAAATACEDQWVAVVIPSDGVVSGDSSSSNQVMVCGANTPPVWSENIGPFDIDEDSEENIFFMSAYVSDNEQAYSQMAFSIQENSGSAVLAASFSGADLVLTTLEQNYFTDGSITLKLVVDDLGGFLDTTEVNVNILSVNDMPLILAYAGADSLDEDGSLTLSLDLFNVEDVDNSYPNDFTLDISTGDNYSLSNRTIIIPDLNYNGPLEIIVLVNDGELNSEPFTFQIEVASVNDPPVIISQVTLQITEDSTLTLTLDDLIFEDVDHTDDDMTILLGDGIDYSADNTTITPALNFTGDLAVPVVLFDGQDSSNVFSLVIQVIPVNDAPAVVDPLADIVVDEDSESLSFSLSGTGGIPYFDDPDIATGDLLSYSAYSADDGLITVLLDADSVYVDFLPDSNGVDTLFITATDLGGLSGMDTILVTVNSVNDAPVIISQVTLQITEDSTITLTLDELIFEDADHTVDGLTIFLGEGNNYSVDNTTITPAPNFIGDLAVPVVLFDGQDSSNVFSLVIQVIPVNDAPAVVNPLADIVVDEDSESLAISLTGTDGAPYFDDPDIATGDLLSYSAYSAGDGLITVLLDADSVYVDFLPDSNGVDTLFITALDLGGLTGTDTIPVTVNSVNDVPIILGSTEYSIIEDSNITLSVDSLDIIDVDSEIFTLAILPGDNYTYDELVVSPEPNYYGTLIVSITVSDGDSVSTPFNLNIVVVPVNDTPLPFDLLTPANGTEVVITLLDIMSNTNLEVSWSSSFDADEDEITYSLKLGAFGIDTVLVSTPDTSHSISYELLTAILDSLGTSQGQLFWTVFVTDGIDTINANSQFSLNVNADNVLGIDELLIPDVYALHQNYPNPFNPTTTLKYDLPENAYVTLKIYDIMGREVIALFSNGYQEAGYRSIQWNGLNQYGKPVGSGMYFYMIKTTNFTQTRKMIMLK